MNILHLAKDEKFIDFFAKTISIAGSNSHRFIITTAHIDQPLRYIREIEPYRKVDNNFFSSAEMYSDLQSCDVLLVHFLTLSAARMIMAAPNHVKIVWSGWGADYYHLLPGGESRLLGPDAHRIATKFDAQRIQKNPLLLARLVLRPLRRLYNRHKLLQPAIKRVQYFSAPIPEDYDLLKKYCGNWFSPQYIQLNYASVETFASKVENIEKRNILVGNSASLTNNHIEVFRLLKKHDLTHRKVIVPLSYGDAQYRQVVLDAGHNILGESFQPLVDFMPLNEYNNLIASCSCAIMNQYRQQALGNIGSILQGGARLFLNKKNVTSEFLRARGAYINDIEELNSENTQDLFSELSVDQKKRNILVLDEFWGQKIIELNILKFIECLAL